MTPGTLARRALPVVATSGGLVLWSGVVVPRLPTGPARRAGANVCATAGLVVVARSRGLSWSELGLAGGTWRAGARWGGVALAAVSLAYGAVLAVPGARARLADPAVRAMPVRHIAGRAMLSIPIGTVLCEEVAFRGVLQAVASRQLPPPVALAVTSVVFGVWHVDAILADRPAGAGSPSAGRPGERSVGRSLTLGVAGTGVGGLCLAWLRQRTGSLIAPVGLHLGTNSIGLAAVAAASRAVDTLDRWTTSRASSAPG